VKEWLGALRDLALFAWYFATGLVPSRLRRAASMLKVSVARRPQGAARPAGRPSPRPAPRPKRSLGMRLLPWGIAALVLWGTAAWGGRHIGELLLEDPPPAIDTLRRSEGPKFSLSSSVRDNSGNVIYSFAEEKREYAKYADISPHVVHGLVAVEDEQFFHHQGLNFQGILRAALYDAKASIHARRLVFPQGGSSLTQQLAKQIWVGPARTKERKLKEALYAIHLEKNFTKEEILEFYLNKVYLGDQRFGVESASQYYFGKSAKDLSLTEGALIAGLPQAPSSLSPRSYPDAALKRRNHVLDRMAEAGYETKETVEAAKAQPLGLASTETSGKLYTQQTAAFFVEDVRRQLMADPDLADRVNTAGLEIDTTIDMALQREATRAVREGLRRLDKELSGFRKVPRNLVDEGVDPDTFQHPLWLLPQEEDQVIPGVVLKVEDGEAVVRIGAATAKADRASIAWTHRKRVEDCLKRGDVAPFRVERDAAGLIVRLTLEQDPELDAALVAMDAASGEVVAMVGGYDYQESQFNKATQAWRQAGSSFKPIYYATALERGLRPSTTIRDEPTVFIDPWTLEQYMPENYYERTYGQVTLRQALEKSLNIASVRLLNYVGYKHAIQTAQRCGFTAKLNPYPSMALGAQEVTLLELTSAYSVFPNMGLHVAPTLLRRIRNAKGEILFEHQPDAKEAITPPVAFQMVQLLRGVVQEGTAQDAQSLHREIAGKTGTTDDYSNAWFIGFSPSLVCGVWVGYEKETKPIGEGMAGARAALPIWIDFMRAYFQGRPEEKFSNPGGVDFVEIDRRTGLVASVECPEDDTILETFTRENRPYATCSAAAHRLISLPPCLQRLSVDEDGTLVVRDEFALAALDGDASACPVTIDRVAQVMRYGWAAGSQAAEIPYRFGMPEVSSGEVDSLEGLMALSPHASHDGAFHDFDMLDGRTVIISRNEE
jgi:penicillin-binding protein 1A